MSHLSGPSILISCFVFLVKAVDKQIYSPTGISDSSLLLYSLVSHFQHHLPVAYRITTIRLYPSNLWTLPCKSLILPFHDDLHCSDHLSWKP